MTGTASERWRAELAGWGIPDEILAAAGRSPWGHPVKQFAARADTDLARPAGMSYERTVAALAEVRRLAGHPGNVLDVGAGAGAASLPLARWVSDLTAVDRSPEMLAAFAERAARLSDPVPCNTVEGTWPDVAHQVGVHDVVVCHHVVYDVPEIAPFVGALTDAARHRVVLELTRTHPMSWLAPLWLQFHGLARPRRPTSDDLVAVLHEVGVRALTVDRWTRPEWDGLTRDERVAVVTRRLCLPEDREPDVGAVLDAMPPPGPRQLVTVAWAGAGGDRERGRSSGPAGP